MNGGQRNRRMRKYGESKTTWIMMASVLHVTSGLGLRKFQADGFLLTRLYHGALVIVLKTLFWKRCKISMLEWEAVPQRGIPYVNIGFSTVLYNRSLFSSDNSDLLPMTQYIRLNERSSCFLLAWMELRHSSKYVILILFFTAQIVTRTRLDIRLHVHCLSCVNCKHRGQI